MLDLLVFAAVIHGITLCVASATNIPGYYLICRRRGVSAYWTLLGCVPALGHFLFFLVLSRAASASASARHSQP